MAGSEERVLARASYPYMSRFEDGSSREGLHVHAEEWTVAGATEWVRPELTRGARWRVALHFSGAFDPYVVSRLGWNVDIAQNLSRGNGGGSLGVLGGLGGLGGAAATGLIVVENSAGE